jgi:hypothetical protein
LSLEYKIVLRAWVEESDKSLRFYPYSFV